MQLLQLGSGNPWPHATLYSPTQLQLLHRQRLSISRAQWLLLVGNMDKDKIDRAPSPDDMADLRSFDEDALKLAEMGYVQDMQRKFSVFSVFSVLGVGFSLTNSWFGISAALVAGINSGGPLLVIYGIILVMLISVCVGISLSELASALPNAGGQYFWANELAPKKYANFASYLTGWFAWAGSIFTSASVALAVGSAGVGCWQLSHPDLYVPLFRFKHSLN